MRQEELEIKKKLPLGLKWRSRKILIEQYKNGKIPAIVCDGYACKEGTCYGLGAEVDCRKCDGYGYLVI